MAKRLDRQALKGAFARGKAKRNLDFLVPSKDPEEATPAPEAKEALTTSGPQRRKRAAAERTRAKRKAGARKTTAGRKPAKKQAAPAQEATAAPEPAQAATPVVPDSEAPAPAEAVAAPDVAGTRVVHDVEVARDLAQVEAQLAVSALYDGWAPSAPPAPRPGVARRLRGRVRRACEALLGAAVRGLLGPS
ncbi:MAG: hypothetical protein R3F62_09145 [Planctomycetota bacterium]